MSRHSSLSQIQAMNDGEAALKLASAAGAVKVIGTDDVEQPWWNIGPIWKEIWNIWWGVQTPPWVGVYAKAAGSDTQDWQWVDRAYATTGQTRNTALSYRAAIDWLLDWIDANDWSPTV